MGVCFVERLADQRNTKSVGQKCDRLVAAKALALAKASSLDRHADTTSQGAGLPVGIAKAAATSSSMASM